MNVPVPKIVPYFGEKFFAVCHIDTLHLFLHSQYHTLPLLLLLCHGLDICQSSLELIQHRDSSFSSHCTWNNSGGGAMLSWDPELRGIQISVEFQTLCGCGASPEAKYTEPQKKPRIF
jgi:hypothetical protein